jgi:hypothetical protein
MHVLRQLARTYAVIELTNSARADSTGEPAAELPIVRPGHGGEPSTLAETSDEIKDTRVSLEKQLATPPGAVLRVASFVLTSIGAALILVELFVQRPDLSNRTVAAAIQTATLTTVGGTSSVECNGAGTDDWLCKVIQLIPSARACPATHATRWPTGDSAVDLVDYVSTTSSSCENKLGTAV